MSDLVFYSNPQSRGGIAHWMLEELGEPYETQWLAYGDQMKSPDYLAINPMGKVPAIRHTRKGRAVVVTETAAICAYLAAAYPAKALIPASDSPALADFYRWLFFAAGPLEMAITAKMLQWTPTPEQTMSVGYGTYDTTLDALATHLADREYICGDAFTAADVYVGGHLIWGLEFKTLAPRPPFQPYAARLAQREAHQRATALAAQQQAAN